MSRNNTRKKAINSNEMYKNIFDDRGVQQIEQFRTPEIIYPNSQQRNRVRTVNFTWRRGDKFWRIAANQYGDPELWWVIAQYNKKPTEAHLRPGDVIQVPLEIGPALGALT